MFERTVGVGLWLATTILLAGINVYTINTMTYDPIKRKSNRRKHAIDLAECEPVFDEPMLTREDYAPSIQ